MRWNWSLAMPGLLCLALMTFVAGGPLRAEEPTPKIIPTPKNCEFREGTLKLSKASRIVVGQAELMPIATTLAAEIKQLAGMELAVVNASPREGDIQIRQEASARLDKEDYFISVGEGGGQVCASTPLALAQATSTLLQSLRVTEAGAEIPGMAILDGPDCEFRGLMVDCARYWHSPETLKQLVTLCHWYKIRYLHLHLTDDQAFTFPSTAFPELVTKDRHYTREQLRGLETFAKDRGVVLIPELDVPGHATAFVQSLPKLFGTNPAPVGDCATARGQAICAGREETYRALDTLVGEMCQVFETSPYFHIGADEINYRYWKECADTKAYMAAHQIDSVEELYRHFLVRMNEIVKKHGKTTIVWEGFSKAGKIDIPRDILVEVFECQYNLPPDLLAGGYRIINAAWQPLYVVGGDPKKMWSPEHILGWNHFRWESCWPTSKAYQDPIVVEPTSNVLGAQICAWEQPQEIELSTLRERVAALSERVWNPRASRSFDDFSQRFQATNAALEKLLQP